MFCKKCGGNIADDSVFCNVCGVRIAGGGGGQQEGQGFLPKGGAAGPGPAGEEEDVERDIWEGSRSWKKFLLYYVLACIVIIGGIVVALTFDDSRLKDIPYLKDIELVREYTETVVGYAKFLPLLIGIFVLVAVLLKTFVFTHKIRYRLTNERFFVIKGILSKEVEEVELIRVNDVTMKQGAIDRMLGIGTVTMISNDETAPRIVLAGIPDPEGVKEHIRKASAKRRKSGVFVERI